METEEYQKLKDDRTDDEKWTHNVLIGGRDSSMSGWGQAEGKSSYAYWACTEDDAEAVYEWVSGRSDIPNVQTHRKMKDAGIDNALVHVYVVGEGHPALQNLKPEPTNKTPLIHRIAKFEPVIRKVV